MLRRGASQNAPCLLLRNRMPDFIKIARNRNVPVFVFRLRRDTAENGPVYFFSSFFVDACH
ncbi:MAG: hypothetical protein DPW13_05030 [Planctomycetes bacterium]|nr:hypothetical protein [Planctomycetota bacterium]